MRIAFRVDASTKIGTGHVMRCLTLADALNLKGYRIIFISRELGGNLNQYIEQRGYEVYRLRTTEQTVKTAAGIRSHRLCYADWLSVSKRKDAIQCILILENFRPDWIVIDHYALELSWQDKVRPYCKYVMVIDDLADRKHHCDVLLDQSFGKTSDKYKKLVNQHCKVLVGSRFSLLRPEFKRLRPYSLKRRHGGSLKRIIVSMGGIDKENYTGRVIKQLQPFVAARGIEVVVVMGGKSPSLNDVRDQVNLIDGKIDIKVDVGNMAEIMSECDLAIGAAGSTSWERCCLGLPTLMLILAENQREIANSLESSGAAKIVQNVKDLAGYLSANQYEKIDLTGMSESAACVTDGCGVDYVVEQMLISK